MIDLEKKPSKLYVRQVHAAGTATAIIPSITFVAETFDCINTVASGINNADDETEIVSLTMEDANKIMDYLDTIRTALLTEVKPDKKKEF